MDFEGSTEGFVNIWVEVRNGKRKRRRRIRLWRVQGGRMDENTSVETRTERKREKDGKKQGSGKGKERGLEDVRK